MSPLTRDILKIAKRTYAQLHEGPLPDDDELLAQPWLYAVVRFVRGREDS